MTFQDDADANVALPPCTKSSPVSHSNCTLVQTTSGIIPVLGDNMFVQPPLEIDDIVIQFASFSGMMINPHQVGRLGFRHNSGT